MEVECSMGRLQPGLYQRFRDGRKDAWGAFHGMGCKRTRRDAFDNSVQEIIASHPFSKNVLKYCEDRLDVVEGGDVGRKW